MLLLQRKKQQQPMSCPDSFQAIERSVVTFYHENIKQEVDLQDYEVLVESYKFLARNHRRSKQLKSASTHQRRNLFVRDDSWSSVSSHDETTNQNGTIVVTNKHKLAILTLVEIDPCSKRVVRIRPEFFPTDARVLPASLSRLDGLKSLALDHCPRLTCLPAGFGIPSLTEFRVNVTSFQEPFPSSFGTFSKQLRTLVVKGNASCLDDWTKGGHCDEEDAATALLLFPPSMAKLSNLRHVETHIRNLLQIPSRVLEIWSASLEELVITQDLSSSSSSSPNNSSHNPSAHAKKNFLPSSDDSSDDDFYHLLDESTDDDAESSDDGFSILKHSSLFREALKSQLEVRAYRVVSRFRNLRSLRLLLDDTKHRNDFSARKNRLKNKRRLLKGKPAAVGSVEEAPYCVPLTLLAGPMSHSLKELDIGTRVASTTSSASRKKSKIPVEIAWIDVLQEFPNLERLRLQDCRCSFVGKAPTVAASSTLLVESQDQPDESSLKLPELRQLILDRCPDFALVQHSSSCLSPAAPEPTISRSEEIRFDHDEEEEEDNDGIKPEYFQPLNDADVDAMVENDPEEISRIIRLSGLLADTILSKGDESNLDEAHKQQLSDLSTRFLRRCPKLEILSLRDCHIPLFSNDLLECLPRESLEELTLDIYSRVTHSDLWGLLEAFPSLLRLQGTCLNGLTDDEAEEMHRLLVQRQRNHTFSGSGSHHSRGESPRPLRKLWDRVMDSSNHSSSSSSHRNENRNPAAADARDPSVEKDLEPKEHPPRAAFRLPWPVKTVLEQKPIAVLEQTLLDLESAAGGVLRSIQRTNSREMM